jgi:hypothetical protein
MVIAGTTRYMAPEQLLGKGDYASDVYSLGVVAYEMLTGRCPREGESPFDLLEAQMRGDVASPRKLRPEVPASAARLILKALSFHPESRPMPAGVFARSLSRALTKSTRWAHPVWTAAGVAALAAGLAIVPPRLASHTDADLVRVMEKRNSTDPAADGFETLHDTSSDLLGMVAMNAENSGYEGWRTTTRRQGSYVRDLSVRQEEEALRRGWKMSAVSRVEEGGSFVIVAFKGVHRRFDIFTFVDENGDTAVRLITKLLPSFDGLEYHLKGSGRSFHLYALAYDPRSKRAELLVDGVRRLGEYAGHNEYADHSWFVFGPHVYRSPQAAATFQTLRFEIQ